MEDNKNLVQVKKVTFEFEDSGFFKWNINDVDASEITEDLKITSEELLKVTRAMSKVCVSIWNAIDDKIYAMEEQQNGNND